MKSINSIMILTLAAFLIVRFWLMPGINKATAMQYVRVYEDTDHDTRVAKDTSKREEKKVNPEKRSGLPEEAEKRAEYKPADYGKKVENDKIAKPAKPKKVYKSQTIRPKDKAVKLEAKMFSRAVQFIEEVPLDSTETVVVEEPVSKAPF